MSNAGESRGWGRVEKPPVAEVMAAYDRLPAPLRTVLANADLDWPTAPFLDRVTSGTPVPALVAQVHSFERAQRA